MLLSMRCFMIASSSRYFFTAYGVVRFEFFMLNIFLVAEMKVRVKSFKF